MSSPAQRYAAFRKQQAEDGPELTRFQALYDFSFDEFQRRACRALNEGHGVLVAAPTGSGKTVVGEFAVHLALAEGRKCFYTTPIKALSNQKYGDLVRRYGADSVGLLTGDNSINGEAPVVVMTTEVLRNMLYGGSATLAGLSYVVLDEVHYLADAFRGAVWEEVIIHLPESVRVVALSATVSNAEEFGDWLTQVRGGTTVIVDEHRPVPLWQHVLAGALLYDLFVEDGAVTGPGKRGQADGERAAQVNPELLRLARREQWAPPGGRGGRPARYRPPRRPQVIGRLDAAGLLPAITFIFSRAGCDAAVRQCLDAGLHLTTPDEAAVITEDRGTPDRGHPGSRPPGARLRRVAHRPAARARRSPRGHAAHLQGGGRGAVRGRAGAGGLRDRDAGARDQHAGPHGGHRAARQVERRGPPRADAGGVHAADRPGRAAGNRRRGPRGGAVAPRHGRRGGGRAAPAPGHIPSTRASAPPTTWR